MGLFSSGTCTEMTSTFSYLWCICKVKKIWISIQYLELLVHFPILLHVLMMLISLLQYVCYIVVYLAFLLDTTLVIKYSGVSLFKVSVLSKFFPFRVRCYLLMYSISRSLHYLNRINLLVH